MRVGEKYLKDAQHKVWIEKRAQELYEEQILKQEKLKQKEALKSIYKELNIKFIE